MIHLLLPAYNEEKALEPLIAKIAAELPRWGATYRVVVIDDGSSDRTPEILQHLRQRYRIDVVTHKYNRGLGETVRDGFEYIAERASRDDVVVRLDCDYTHDPKYIRSMVDKLNEGYEVVTASRYARGGGQVGVDWYRRAISRVANLLMKTVFPISGVWEYTCGFRAYRVSFIQDALAMFGNRFIDLKGMGFTGTVEKMIKCKMMGARVSQVPFVLRYDKKMSSSKIVTSITTLGYLTLIVKYFVVWGELGQQWKREAADRQRQLRTPEGRLAPVSID